MTRVPEFFSFVYAIAGVKSAPSPFFRRARFSVLSASIATMRCYGGSGGLARRHGGGDGLSRRDDGSGRSRLHQNHCPFTQSGLSFIRDSFFQLQIQENPIQKILRLDSRARYQS